MNEMDFTVNLRFLSELLIRYSLCHFIVRQNLYLRALIGCKPNLGAYSEKYFNDIAYVSDSQGEFRYGHPFNHDAFKMLQNMQLLIHPIWWVTDDFSSIEKIKNLLEHNTTLMSDHIARNCVPWKKHNE